MATVNACLEKVAAGERRQSVDHACSDWYTLVLVVPDVSSSSKNCSRLEIEYRSSDHSNRHGASYATVAMLMNDWHSVLCCACFGSLFVVHWLFPEVFLSAVDSPNVLDRVDRTIAVDCREASHRHRTVVDERASVHWFCIRLTRGQAEGVDRVCWVNVKCIHWNEHISSVYILALWSRARAMLDQHAVKSSGHPEDSLANERWSKVEERRIARVTAH